MLIPDYKYYYFSLFIRLSLESFLFFLKEHPDVKKEEEKSIKKGNQVYLGGLNGCL